MQIYWNKMGSPCINSILIFSCTENQIYNLPHNCRYILGSGLTPSVCRFKLCQCCSLTQAQLTFSSENVQRSGRIQICLAHSMRLEIFIVSMLLSLGSRTRLGMIQFQRNTCWIKKWVNQAFDTPLEIGLDPLCSQLRSKTLCLITSVLSSWFLG